MLYVSQHFEHLLSIIPDSAQVASFMIESTYECVHVVTDDVVAEDDSASIVSVPLSYAWVCVYPAPLYEEYPAAAACLLDSCMYSSTLVKPLQLTEIVDPHTTATVRIPLKAIFNILTFLMSAPFHAV